MLGPVPYWVSDFLELTPRPVSPSRASSLFRSDELLRSGSQMITFSYGRLMHDREAIRDQKFLPRSTMEYWHSGPIKLILIKSGQKISMSKCYRLPITLYIIDLLLAHSHSIRQTHVEYRICFPSQWGTGYLWKSLHNKYVPFAN